MVEKENIMTNPNNRPGNMKNIYENRKTLEYGKIISYDDKFKTMIIELSDGKAKSITYSTFRSAWRKKAIATEEIIEETTEDHNDDEYIAEIMQQKKDLGIECPPITEEPEIVEEVKIEKPTKKSSKARKLIEYDGRSQGLSDWCRELGLNVTTLYNRIYNMNMPFEEAISKPIRKKK